MKFDVLRRKMVADNVLRGVVDLGCVGLAPAVEGAGVGLRFVRRGVSHRFMRVLDATPRATFTAHSSGPV